MWRWRALNAYRYIDTLTQYSFKHQWNRGGESLPSQPILVCFFATLGLQPTPPNPRGFALLDSCWLILAPRCHNIAQDSLKNTILQPESSNIAPKTLPRQPLGPSRVTWKLQNPSKLKDGFSFSHLGLFSKTHQQNTNKMVKVKSQVGYLTPNFAHLGANLGLSSPILPILGAQDATQLAF